MALGKKGSFWRCGVSVSLLKQPKSLNGGCRCDGNKGGSGAEGISEKRRKPVKWAGIGQPIKPWGKGLLSRDMPPTAILSFSAPVIRSIHTDTYYWARKNISFNNVHKLQT